MSKIKHEDLDDIPDDDKYYFDTLTNCTPECRKVLYHGAINSKDNDEEEGAIIGKHIISMNKLYRIMRDNMVAYNDLYKEYIKYKVLVENYDLD
jgi:hypothetical protein